MCKNFRLVSIHRLLQISLIALSLILLWSACRNPLASPPTLANETSFRIKYGQIRRHLPTGLSVEFRDVISEGRCPRGVVCCWEGMAEIQIHVETADAQRALLTLPIYGYVGADDSARHLGVETLGYNFKLINLDPYPDINRENDPTEAVATIQIQKVTEADHAS